MLGRREIFESCYELTEMFTQLLPAGRTDKLALVTDEMFPTQRPVNDDVACTEMEGVEHLGQYVYEMTQAKVEALKAADGVLPVADDHGAMEQEFREDEEMKQMDGGEAEDSEEEGEEETMALQDTVDGGE